MNTRKLALALTLLLAVTAVAAQPDYTGTWRLDKEASKDLPQRYQEGVADWTLDVSRDAKTFTVDVAITPKDDSMPRVNNKFVHKLDGSESDVEVMVRTPEGPQKVIAKSKMTILENGEFDVVTSDGRMKSSEHWRLDGDVLRVQRTDETPRGPMTFELAFRRK